jgi:hypothetical protein
MAGGAGRSLVTNHDREGALQHQQRLIGSGVDVAGSRTQPSGHCHSLMLSAVGFGAGQTKRNLSAEEVGRAADKAERQDSRLLRRSCQLLPRIGHAIGCSR